MSIQQKEDSYYSYNDLNRPAMWCGVPIVITLILSVATLILSGLFFFLFKLAGLLITLFLGLIIFFICRIVCENDPNGLYNKKYIILGLFMRLKSGKKIITLSSNQNISGYK